MEHQAETINGLSRQLKLATVQCRIEIVRHKLHECKACTPESRQLLNKLLSLAQQRNRMHTAADVLRIDLEKESA